MVSVTNLGASNKTNRFTSFIKYSLNMFSKIMSNIKKHSKMFLIKAFFTVSAVKNNIRRRVFIFLTSSGCFKGSGSGLKLIFH